MKNQLIFFLLLLLSISQQSFGQFFSPNPNPLSIEKRETDFFLDELLGTIEVKSTYYKLPEDVLKTVLLVQSNAGRTLTYNYGRILPRKELTKYPSFSHGSDKSGLLNIDSRRHGIEATALAMSLLANKESLPEYKWWTLLTGSGADLEPLAPQLDEVYKILTGISFEELAREYEEKLRKQRFNSSHKAEELSATTQAIEEPTVINPKSFEGTRFGNLEERLTTQETRLADLESRTAQLEKLETKIRDLGDSLASAQIRIASLEKENENLKANLVEKSRQQEAVVSLEKNQKRETMVNEENSSASQVSNDEETTTTNVTELTTGYETQPFRYANKDFGLVLGVQLHDFLDKDYFFTAPATPFEPSGEVQGAVLTTINSAFIRAEVEAGDLDKMGNLFIPLEVRVGVLSGAETFNFGVGADGLMKGYAIGGFGGVGISLPYGIQISGGLSVTRIQLTPKSKPLFAEAVALDGFTPPLGFTFIRGEIQANWTLPKFPLTVGTRYIISQGFFRTIRVGLRLSSNKNK